MYAARLKDADIHKGIMEKANTLEAQLIFKT